MRGDLKYVPKWFVAIIRSVRRARCAVVLLISAGVLFGGSSILCAGTAGVCEEPKSCTTLPGEDCRVSSRKEWTEPEKWAWEKICEGQDANFHSKWSYDYDYICGDDYRWLDRRRTLSSSFLKIILLHEPFRSAIPYRGVRIVGAYFPDRIDLSDASIERPLELHDSLFKSPVVMRRLKTPTIIAFSGSKFERTLDMGSASIGGSLLMGGEEESKTDFEEDVNLSRAKIGGWLDMGNSTFKGELYMTAASIEDELLMQNAIFEKPAKLVFLSVGSNLDAKDANLRELDLTGARIEGDLRLESNVEWKVYKDKDGNLRALKLTLQNASVGRLQYTEKTGSDATKLLELELDGFTYDRIDFYDALKGHDLKVDQKSKGFVDWLKMDKSYSPQPYLHLAGVLRTAGYDGMADKILFENRKRERRDSKMSWLKWLLLWALQITIGYGYGLWNFLALAWIAGLVVAGTVALHFARKRDRHPIISGFLDSACYSLDMLLPVIRLRERHYTDVDLTTWAKYYFYFQQVMGYVLIFFVIAGLSGLTE